MQKYIGSDVTSMVTLPVIIFEPMTMLQKTAEACSVLPEGKTLEDDHMFVVTAILRVLYQIQSFSNKLCFIYCIHENF